MTAASIVLALVVAILVDSDGITFSNGFHVNSAPTFARGRFVDAGRTRLCGAASDRDAVGDDPTTRMTTLHFVGEHVAASAPAPAAGDAAALHEFFVRPGSAPLLLRGAKGNPVQELADPDAGLRQRYRETCARVGARSPTPRDRLFEVTTAGVTLPGLRIKSVAIIGVQVTDGDPPGYEFVLVGDATSAEGNKLFVWFFNKVTGKGKGGDEDEKEQTTFSVNRITVVPTENDEVAFESTAYLSIKLKFPSLLMKAIPGASKEKFEKTGSAALRKVLEDDCPAALESFRQEYARWLEN